MQKNRKGTVMVMSRGIDFINESNKVFSNKEIKIKTIGVKEYTILISPKIKDTDVSKLVSVLMSNAEYCNKNNKEYNIVVDMYANIIKSFTDIKFNTYKDQWKQIAHNIEVCSALIDLGVYDEIVKHFDKESIEKIQESFNTYKKSFKMINNHMLSQQIKDDKNVSDK